MTKRFVKRAVSVICAAVLLTAGAGIDTSASDVSSIESEINELREQNERRRGQIRELDGDIDGNEEKMSLISEQIDGVNAELAKYKELIAAKEKAIDKKFCEIKAVEEKISVKEGEIEAKQADVARLNAENAENLRRFAKLARALYINNSSDNLPVLNGSSDWYDYYMYSDVVENIGKQSLDFMKRLVASIEKQERLIGELNADIDALDESRSALEEEREKFTRQMDELTEQRAELEAEARAKHDDLYALTEKNDELRGRIAALNSEIEEGNAALEALNTELEELIRASQQDNPDRTEYGGELIWPLEDCYGYIATYFGYDAELDRQHRGIDVGDSGIGGSNIYAAQSGTVISVVNYCSHDYGKSWSCGCGGGYGRYIVIDHGGGLSTLYAHCRAIYVYEGQQVSRGDVIGLVGSTGYSFADHLHFEVRENGTAVDPFLYV